MKRQTESQLLEWANERGIVVDEDYPESAVLSFSSGKNDNRFWSIPPEPEERPHFFATMLNLMGEWKTCYVWRHLGSWPETADPQRVNDNVELQILKGIGIPLGTNDVLGFSRSEVSQLITLMFSSSIFGWSCQEDLYIIPDNTLHIMQTDHHGVMHVSFRNDEQVNPFIEEMNHQGFSLPEDIPDETFKRPEWMIPKPKQKTSPGLFSLLTKLRNPGKD